MDPVRKMFQPVVVRLPRTRGDGPEAEEEARNLDTASPHTRGWTLVTGFRPVTRRGFPAHAGMDPPTIRPGSTSWRLPRTRGDGPWVCVRDRQLQRASPHTRGWTRPRSNGRHDRDGFPAHAGMDPMRARVQPALRGLPRTRGDGPRVRYRGALAGSASPHTRGWTPFRRSHRSRPCGFPAHAGMDPRPPG